MAKKPEHEKQKQHCNKFNKDFKMVHIFFKKLSLKNNRNEIYLGSRALNALLLDCVAFPPLLLISDWDVQYYTKMFLRKIKTPISVVL